MWKKNCVTEMKKNQNKHKTPKNDNKLENRHIGWRVVCRDWAVSPVGADGTSSFHL